VYLGFDPGEEAPINRLLGASITYRIATGPREGQKVFTLQTLPAEPEVPRREVALELRVLAARGHRGEGPQRDKLERLGCNTESVDPAHPSRAPPQGDLLI
jgi:hypothetical protein